MGEVEEFDMVALQKMVHSAESSGFGVLPVAESAESACSYYPGSRYSSSTFTKLVGHLWLHQCIVGCFRHFVVHFKVL